MLKLRADLCKVKHIDIFHENDAMRISHADARNTVRFLPDCARGIHHTFLVQLHRNFFWRKFRCPHIHAHALYRAVFNSQPQRFDAALRIYLQRIFAAQTAVVNVFPHAANAVSAHFCAGTICIVDIHFAIRTGARLN